MNTPYKTLLQQDPSDGVSAIRRLVQSCGIQNFEKTHGTSLLLGAIHHNHFEILQFLTQDEPLVNVDPSSSLLGHRPLITACLPYHENDGYRIARLLRQKGANPNLGDKHGRTAMHVIISHRNFEAFKALLQHLRDVDIEARDKQLQTPLHYACKAGQSRVIRLLLEHGADAGVKDEHKSTPLYWYCGQSNVHPDILLMLLTNDPTATDAVHSYSGKTPLHCLLCYPSKDSQHTENDASPECFDILLNASHKVLDLRDNRTSGYTPLGLALRSFSSGWRRGLSVPFIEKLALASNNVGAQELDAAWGWNSTGRNHLSLPARLKMLILERFISSAKRDQDKLTPLLVYCDAGGSHADMETLRILLARDPTAAGKTDLNGSTPLHYLFSFDDFSGDLVDQDGELVYEEDFRDFPPVDFVAALLDAFPAAASIQDNDGHVPLWLALENYYPPPLLDVLVPASPVDDDLMEMAWNWPYRGNVLPFTTRKLMVGRYSTFALGKPDGYATTYPIHALVQCPLPAVDNYRMYIDQCPLEKVVTLNERGQLPLHVAVCFGAKVPATVVLGLLRLEPRAAAVKDPSTGFYPYEAAACHSETLGRENVLDNSLGQPRLLSLVYALLRFEPHMLRLRLDI